MPSARNAAAPVPAADDQHRRRIAELEERLREAEQTLDAIRAGEVDAVVVGDAAGSPRVYTLTTADRPYRLLIEEIQEGAVTLSADGVVLYCNRALADILRTPQERVIGGRLQGFAPASEAAALTRLLAHGGRSGLTLLAADGAPVPVHLSLSWLPAGDDDAAPVLCGVVADLTEREARARELAEAYGRLSREVAERERAEALLHQAQKMEALGQLAGGVAHDFNNSAAVVLAGLALLDRRHGAALAAAGPEVGRLLAGLKEGAERGASVARRLLAFARREELRAADIDPAELLGGLRDVLATALGPSGVRVRVEASPTLPPLRADRATLETTLINLAVNARDAMPAGGTVVLGADAEDLAPERARELGLPPGVHLRIRVVDTGAGMDAATLARATEPFFTTKPKGHGTGLGLSMADGFAAQSGGALRIESAPGRGTTVTFWLPRADGSDTEPALQSAIAPQRRRALVVGDTPFMRRYLSDCLHHAGWRSVEAAAAAEALELLGAGQPFDALVTHVAAPPGPDGLALLRDARALCPGLSAVLISGPDAPPGLASAAGLEDVRLLRKPVSPSELSEVLASLP